MRVTQTLGVLLIALLLSGFGCSTVDTQKSFAVSGETMIAAGNQFVATANLYMRGCKPVVQKGLETFCPGFKAFAPKFKQAYPPAVASWKAAVKANDAVAAQGAQTAVVNLVTELSEIAAQAIGGTK
jgi:hypothetical protein